MADISATDAVYGSMVFGLNNTNSVLLYDTINKKPEDSDCTELSKTYNRGKAHVSYEIMLPDKAVPNKYRKASFIVHGKVRDKIISTYYKGKKIHLKISEYLSVGDNAILTGVKTREKANCGTVSKKYPAEKNVEYDVTKLTEKDYNSLHPGVSYIKLSDGKIYQVSMMSFSGNRYQITAVPVTEIRSTKQYAVNNSALTVDDNSYTETIDTGDNIIVPIVDLNEDVQNEIQKSSGSDTKKMYEMLQKIFVVFRADAITKENGKIIITGAQEDISEKACMDRLKKIWANIAK